MLLNTEHFDLQKWFTRRKKGRAFLFCFFVVVFFVAFNGCGPSVGYFCFVSCLVTEFSTARYFVCLFFFLFSFTHQRNGRYRVVVPSFGAIEAVSFSNRLF